MQGRAAYKQEFEESLHFHLAVCHERREKGVQARYPLERLFSCCRCVRLVSPFHTPESRVKTPKRQRVDEYEERPSPEPKKQKIPESPPAFQLPAPSPNIIIRNVVPQMCEVSLADIGQQITSISGDSVPACARLFFGTVEARPLISHVYFIPKLSEIPKEHVRWTQETQGLIVMEKFFVSIEARDNLNVILFQTPDGRLNTSSTFVYIGKHDLHDSRF